MNLFGHNKEQHILNLFTEGDAAAMDELYAEYADYLTRICSRYIENQENLRDVLQEAFIRIFTRIRTFEYRGKGSLKAWLTKVVVNESLYFIRESDACLFIDEEEVSLHDIEEENPDIDSLSITQITDAIQKLPPGYRTVFNLHVIEEKTHKEIAKLLNIKPDSSASQFHKARNMLARMLKAQNIKVYDNERKMA